MRTAVKASVLSVGALVLAGALNAGQCGYEQCWGAVGIGPGGAYGWAHSHASEGAAYNAAQRGCRGNCDQIRTFYNTCGAIARASNGGWGWGWASSRQAAENTALGYCREYGANCRVAVWACSP